MQDASSADTEANFDIEQFVHTSGEGFGNDRPMDADNGSVDVAALGSVAGTPTVAGKKMSRREKKQAKREVARLKKEAKLAEKEARKSYTSVKSQLKDRDKELTSKTADARRKREGAKDVVNYIGYNRMYQDGICEVEEGLFSSSISFGDTSYHSVRDEQQKSMFSALTRLYDQFGANTLVQMSVINTPLLKEEVGNRKFFDVARQGNDAARNDAQVFNDILNDKVREGVSNIRRNRYLTYSVTAETADDAARQLSRIETESSRIFNSMGSKAHLMNGTQRLSVIHSLLNPYKPFYFDYQKDISAKRVQTTKDCIAPTQIDWRPDGMFNDCFKLDKGSMDFFNRQSNVDFNTRIVDFNLKDLPDSMLVFALINVCEAVRNRMYFNAKRNVRTWLYVEEMQSLFAYPTVLNYFSRFSNEGRKFGLLLTGITQNAVAMLNNEAAQNIVLNADFIMLLKQSPLDRMRWVELLNLSEQEEECIDESTEAGDGLLIAGNARVPIRGKFPSGNVLYDLFSTNPNETKELNIGSKKKDGKVI